MSECSQVTFYADGSSDICGCPSDFGGIYICPECHAKEMQATIATQAAAIEALREALDLIINMDNQMFTLGDACSVAIKAIAGESK